jgi:hypothetical protein
LAALGSSATVLVVFALASAQQPGQGEPPTINPFGDRPNERPDAVSGFAELSDGTRLAGRLFLTRDTRLKVYDVGQKRHREIPFRAIRQIDCTVVKEWMEKEWRFQENASDQKVYTGRSYPARQYVHTVTLQDSRTIRGPISGVLYVEAKGKRTRLLLYKRHRGPVGSGLESLVYVRRVVLGESAGKPVPPSTGQRTGGGPGVVAPPTGSR